MFHLRYNLRRLNFYFFYRVSMYLSG